MDDVLSTTAMHDGLPVSGYQKQSDENIALVNRNKRLEEVILRMLDALRHDPNVDLRWLAIGRTGIEQAFMAINRAIFQPQRIDLEEDDPKIYEVAAESRHAEPKVP